MPISSEKELPTKPTQPTEPKEIAFTVIIKKLKVLRFGKRKNKHLESIPEVIESPVQERVRRGSLNGGSFQEPQRLMLRPVDLPSSNTKRGGMVKDT